MKKSEPYFYPYTNGNHMAHTNASIRKLLGERGFIQDFSRDNVYPHEYVTYWRRKDEEVTLHEYTEKGPDIKVKNERGRNYTLKNPELSLGYRNLEIQNDGSRDE